LVISVSVDAVSSYSELLKTKAINPYQGLMIDLVTQMKMPAEEKNIAKEMLGIFPAIQLKWDAESRFIRNISFGNRTTSNSLKDFINTECQSFKARAFRLDIRKMLHFNVMLSNDESMDEKDLERTVTINISKAGCFLFSGRAWTKYPTAWLIINDLQDKTLITGDIRWSVEWGKQRMIPGIGISFKQIKPSQIEELIDN
jgi:hypothetical protein